MKYITYAEKGYTADMVKGMGEVIGWLRGERFLVDGAADHWHKAMVGFAHEHVSSILGPFCMACRCSLPGPNGEWT